MNKLPMVYVAGRFRGASLAEIQFNIDVAGRFAAEVAKAGCVPIVPHVMEGLRMHDLNQANDGEWWLRATMQMLEVCDAVVVVPGWHESRGTLAEVARARALELPVFEAYWAEIFNLPTRMPTPVHPAYWLDRHSPGVTNFAEWVAERTKSPATTGQP